MFLNIKWDTVEKEPIYVIARVNAERKREILDY
jgi:hypothetical protein